MSKFLLLIIGSLLPFFSKTVTAAPLLYRQEKSSQNEAVAINISIQVNKVYNINSTDETYQIDGYLVATWQLSKGVDTPILYENYIADEHIGVDIWIPAFEFINVVNKRDIANKQVKVNRQGMVTYNERFNATFSQQMDFRIFPFDSQLFMIQLEAFSYDKSQVFFTTDQKSHTPVDNEMNEEWEVRDSHVFTQDISYYHLDPSPTVFSRFVLEIAAKRKVNRYFWQLIFPLILIISISWLVFWIRNISDQLATGFTLMLTLVAFNFNTSSMLPTLPYMTLIESLITVGYVSVFVVLIIVILGRALVFTKSPENYRKLILACRYTLPLCLIVIMLLSCWMFFYQSTNS